MAPVRSERGKPAKNRTVDSFEDSRATVMRSQQAERASSCASAAASACGNRGEMRPRQDRRARGRGFASNFPSGCGFRRTLCASSDTARNSLLILSPLLSTVERRPAGGGGE